MARVRVKLNSRGMDDLLHDDGVRDFLAGRAERVADQARRTAPVETGEYRESIHVETDVTDRVVARVVSDDDKSHWIESWTGNLSRALDAAGGE